MQLSEFKSYFINNLRSQYNSQEKETLFRTLIGYHLNLNRAELHLNLKRDLKEKELDSLKMALLELNNSKPIDYIIHETIFMGYPFYVDERVLIPRPETEELVMFILESESNNHGIEILDIGTGSACIPIGLYKENTSFKIDACDVSEGALEVAKINCEELDAKIDLLELDILNETPRKYDVIVSNPPYVKEEELIGLDKNVVEFEPLIALAPKGDPLLFYRRMIELKSEILKPNGRFYWEIHEDMGEEVLALLRQNNFKEIELRKDMYDRDRLVRAVYSV